MIVAASVSANVLIVVHSHLILSGASLTLRAPTLVSVLVEVNEEFRELASEVGRHLTEAGFALEGKYHAEMCDSGQFATSFNQIWVRPKSFSSPQGYS